jgi:hypothetical protein
MAEEGDRPIALDEKLEEMVIMSRLPCGNPREAVRGPYIKANKKLERKGSFIISIKEEVKRKALMFSAYRVYPSEKSEPKDSSDKTSGNTLPEASTLSEVTGKRKSASRFTIEPVGDGLSCKLIADRKYILVARKPKKKDLENRIRVLCGETGENDYALTKYILNEWLLNDGVLKTKEVIKKDLKKWFVEKEWFVNDKINSKNFESITEKIINAFKAKPKNEEEKEQETKEPETLRKVRKYLTLGKTNIGKKLEHCFKAEAKNPLASLHLSILDFANLGPVSHSDYFTRRHLVNWLVEAPLVEFKKIDRRIEAQDVSWIAREHGPTRGTRFALNSQDGEGEGTFVGSSCLAYYRNDQNKNVGNSQKLDIMEHCYGKDLQLRAPPSTHTKVGVLSTTRFDFLCSKAKHVGVDGDDGAVEKECSTELDLVTGNSFYLKSPGDTEPKHNLASDPTKKAKKGIDHAFQRFKKLDEVYPLSVVKDTVLLPLPKMRERLIFWFVWALATIILTLCFLIPVNVQVLVVPLNSTLPVILDVADCDINIHTDPRSKHPRVWPTWYVAFEWLFFPKRYNADLSLLTKREMVIVTTMGQLRPVDAMSQMETLHDMYGGVSRKWSSKLLPRYGGGKLMFHENIVTVRGGKTYVMQGRCVLDFYIDSGAIAQGVPEISIRGSGYSYRSPMVVKLVAKESHGGLWQGVAINSTALNVELNDMAINELSIHTTAGLVSLHSVQIRKKAFLRMGVNLKNGKLCQPPGNHNTKTTNGTNGTLIRTNNESAAPAVLEGCDGAGGDIYIHTSSSIHVIAKQLKDMVCLSAPVANTIHGNYQRNGTQEAILCVNETNCADLPTVQTEVFDGGIFIDVENLYKNGSRLSKKTLAGIDSNPFIGARSLNQLGRTELKSVNRWLEEESARDHVVWIPVSVNGVQYSFWWASRKIFLQFPSYLFDIVSVGFLKPKMRKSPVRILPGFCPSQVGEKGSLLPQNQGGEISQIITDTIASGIGTSLVVQSNVSGSMLEPSIEYDPQANGNYEKREVSIIKNPVMILATSVSILIACLGAAGTLWILRRTRKALTEHFREYLITKIKTGRELIRAEGENEVAEDREDNERTLTFFSLVKENEINMLSLSYFQCMDLVFSRTIGRKFEADSVTSFFSQSGDVKCKDVKNPPRKWWLSRTLVSVGRYLKSFFCPTVIKVYDDVGRNEVLLSKVESKYWQWCIKKGRKPKRLRQQHVQDFLLERFNIKSVKHMVDCYIGVRWWNVSRDGAKVDRTQEYYKGSVSMYFLGTETQMSPLATDYISSEEFEEKYRLFCAERNLNPEHLAPEDLRSLKIKRSRLPVDYVSGVELKSNKELNGPTRSYVTGSSFLAILHSLLIFLPPVPLLVLIFYSQESYMTYSGRFYHVSERHLVGFQDWSLFFETSSSEFLAFFLPHNTAFVLLTIAYWAVGSLYLMCYYLNMNVSSPLKREEVLLGGTPIHLVSQLDNTIELLYNRHRDNSDSFGAERLFTKLTLLLVYITWLFLIIPFLLYRLIKIQKIGRCADLLKTARDLLKKMKTLFAYEKTYIFRQRFAGRLIRSQDGAGDADGSDNFGQKSVRLLFDELIKEHSIHPDYEEVSSLLKMILRSADENNPILVSLEKNAYLQVLYCIGAVCHVLFTVVSNLLLALYAFYTTLVLEWLVLGAIVNPTQMLPFASTVVAVFTFIAAKASSLKKLEADTKRSLTDVIRKELQENLSKLDLELLGIPMSEKVLSAFVTGDTTTLAKTSLSMDIIHDTIVPLKAQILSVSETVGVDEQTIKALASGNPDEIAKICLEKLDMDPNLGALIVNIVRHDYKAATTAFEAVAKAVTGETKTSNDEMFFEFCSSLLKIMTMEGSAMGREVVEKKVLSKFLLYLQQNVEEKNKMGKQVLELLSAESIFALIDLHQKSTVGTILTIAQLMARLVENNILHADISNNGLTSRPFSSLLELCKYFLTKKGDQHDMIFDASSELLGKLKPLVRNCLHVAGGSEKNKDQLNKIVDYIDAMLQAIQGNNLALRGLLAENIISISPKTNVMYDDEKRLMPDLLEVALTVLSPKGAMIGRTKILNLIEKICKLKRLEGTEMEAEKNRIVPFVSFILPAVPEFKRVLDNTNLLRDTSRKIQKIGSIVHALASGRLSDLSYRGLPLIEEIERRGLIVTRRVIPILPIEENEKANLLLLVGMMVGSDTHFKDFLRKMLDLLGLSPNVKMFVECVFICCLNLRKSKREGVLKFEEVLAAANVDFVETVLQILRKEISAGRKTTIERVMEPYVFSLFNELIENYTSEKLKGKDIKTFKNKATRVATALFKKYRMLSGFVEGMLTLVKASPVQQKRTLAVLKMTFKSSVAPQASFSHGNLEPALEKTKNDILSVSGMFDVPDKCLSVILEMLYSIQPLEKAILISKDTMAAFDIEQKCIHDFFQAQQKNAAGPSAQQLQTIEDWVKLLGMKDKTKKSNPQKMMRDLVVPAINLVRSIAAQAALVRCDTDYTNIAELIELLALQAQTVSSMFVSKFSEEAVDQLMFCLDLLKMFSGVLSPKSKTNSKELAKTLVQHISTRFKNGEHKDEHKDKVKNSEIMTAEEKGLWRRRKGLWQCVEHCVGGLIDLYRHSTHTQNFNKQELENVTSSLIVSAKNLLEEITAKMYNKSIQRITGLLQLGALQKQNTLSAVDTETYGDKFAQCFFYACDGHRKRIKRITGQENHCESLLRVKNFEGNWVSPTSFVEYLKAVACSNEPRMLSSCQKICKKLGLTPRKIGLGMSLLRDSKNSIPFFYQLAQNINLRSNHCIALASLASFNSEQQNIGLPDLAERLGFSDVNVFKGLLCILGGGDYKKKDLEYLAKGIHANGKLLKLLCLCRNNYERDSNDSLSKASKLAEFLQNNFPMVAHKGNCLSSLLLIVSGNRAVLEKIVAAQEGKGEYECNIELSNPAHEVLLKSRGSFVKTLLTAQFGTSVENVRVAMKELFSDFAPFSFYQPGNETDCPYGKKFKYIQIKDAIEEAKSWLKEIIFKGKLNSFGKDRNELIKHFKDLFKEDARRFVKKLEDDFNWKFSKKDDPSTVQDPREEKEVPCEQERHQRENQRENFSFLSYPLAENEVLCEQERHQRENFSFLSYPLAENMEEIYDVSLRLNISVTEFAQHLLVAICQSMKGWRSCIPVTRSEDDHDTTFHLWEETEETNGQNKTKFTDTGERFRASMTLKRFGEKMKDLGYEKCYMREKDQLKETEFTDTEVRFPASMTLKQFGKKIKDLGYVKCYMREKDLDPTDPKKLIGKKGLVTRSEDDHDTPFHLWKYNNAEETNGQNKTKFTDTGERFPASMTLKQFGEKMKDLGYLKCYMREKDQLKVRAKSVKGKMGQLPGHLTLLDVSSALRLGTPKCKQERPRRASGGKAPKTTTGRASLWTCPS